MRIAFTIAAFAPRLRAVAAASLGSLLLAACSAGSPGGSGDPDDPDAPAGAATWAKSYGGPARDQAASGRRRPGGGYVFAGTWNNVAAGSGRITGYDSVGGEGDVWVAALDELGNFEWQRSYGVQSMLPPGDPRFLYTHVAGALDDENDGQSNGTWLVGQVSRADVSGEAGDLAITRLNAADQVLWTRSYDSGPFPTTLSTSEPHLPYLFSDEQTAEGFLAVIAVSPDGGAVVAARAEATVAVPDESGSGGKAVVASAVWVLKVDAAGEPQWSAFLGAGDLIETELFSFRVAALPNRGAVVAYIDVAADLARVVRFDAGAQSANRRWEHTYGVDGVYTDISQVLAVDDNVDGIVDGILVADDDGAVRKLDASDGSEIWRKSIGDLAAGVASTCVPGGTVPCQYAVAAQDGGEALVRTLAPNSGNALAERRFADISWIAGGFGAAVYVAEHNVYQLLARCPGAGGRIFHRCIVHLDAEGDPPQSAGLNTEYEDILDRGFTLAAPDAGGWYVLFLAGEAQELRHMTRFGGISPSPVSLATLGVSVERGFAVGVPAGGDSQGDAGFVVAGEVVFTDTAGAGRKSAWLLRLEPNGDILWQKRLDGFHLTRTSCSARQDGQLDELFRSSPDGGVVVGGHTDDAGRLLKLDANGTIEWLSAPLGLGDLSSTAVVEVTEDGRYMAGGGCGDAWIARLGPRGGVEWQYRYDSLFLTDMHALEDGGVLLAGYRSKALTDEEESFLEERAEIDDSPNSVVMARLDADGAVAWSRSYPSSLREVFLGRARVAPAGDGYLLAAAIRDVVDPADFGRSNVLLIRTDAEGAVLWTQRYGGLYDESVTDVEALPDGGFLISAWSDSMGDYTEAWMLRVGPDGRIAEGCQADLGRASGIVAQPIGMTPQQLAPPEETGPPLIDVIETSVMPAEPSEVVVARQCAGTAGNDTGAPPNARTLTVNLTGTPTGVVTSVPSGIVCGVEGGTCSNVFADGTLVTLRVDIGSLQHFQAFGPGCEPTSEDPAVCTVRMDADKTIDVIFGSIAELSIAGIFGLGSIASTPAGISCPDVCTAPFAGGSTVTLSALPDDGWEFVEWSGDCSGTATDTQVTMDGERACVARFERIEEEDDPPSAAFTFSPPDPQTGQVVSFDASASSDDDGIDLYEWDFEDDGTFDLASADPAAEFTYPDAGSHTVRLRVTDTAGQMAETTQAVTVTAPAGGSFTINVQISNQGGSPSDWVVSEPQGIDCVAGPDPFENEGICSADFTADQVRLFALPDPESGDVFDQWGGCDALEPDPPNPDICVVDNSGGQRDIGAAFIPPGD